MRIITPIQINLFFIALLITPLLFGYGVYEASASKLDDFCERNFNLSFRQSIAPIAYKKCKVQFERIETEWRTGLYSK